MAITKHGSLNNERVDIDMGQNHRYVEVLTRSGSNELWCVADATARGIAAGSIAEVDDVDVIPATGGSVMLDSPGQGNTVVSLEAAGSVSYSLKGFDG